MSTIEAPCITTADVLDRAADILEEFEWCQCDEGSRAEGVMCALGALREAIRDYGLGHRAVCQTFDFMPLMHFNDVKGRTKAEVVAYMRSCATSMRGDAA